MSEPASDLTKSFTRYLHAFNQRDVEGLLAEMHFPHMRLVDDVFQRWETSDGMAEMEEFVTKSLKSEGWHTSEAKLIEAVQVGPALGGNPERRGEIAAELGDWMERKGYATLDAFRGNVLEWLP